MEARRPSDQDMVGSVRVRSRPMLANAMPGGRWPKLVVMLGYVRLSIVIFHCLFRDGSNGIPIRLLQARPRGNPSSRRGRLAR